MAVFGFATVLATVSSLTTGQHSVLAATGINHQINFQGKLTNPDGTNVTDGNYSIVFSIYSVASGGSAIWTETQTVAVSNGIFQVNLGSVTALPGSIDFNTDNIYLGVKVGSDAEMTPRVQFTAVPQAFNAEKLGGLDKTGFVQNGTSAQTASFNVTGTGQIGTSLTVPTLQSAAATGLTITGNAASTWSTTAGALTLQGFGGVTLNTPATGTASTNSSAISILTGNATGTTSNSGSITIDTGTATGTTGTISIGTANSSGLSISKVGATTTVNGNLTVGASAGSGTTFINNGATIDASLAVPDSTTNTTIGNGLAASATVDKYTAFIVTQTTAGRTLTLPSPTVTTAGRVAYVTSSGSSTSSFSLYGVTLAANTSHEYVWSGAAWISSGLTAEADTLATVTARGATTSTASSFTGGLTASGANIGINTSSNFNTNIGDGSTAGSVTIGNAGTNTNTVTIAAGSTNGIALNATQVTTNQATAALFNTTATTVNAFGAATAINLGGSAASVLTLGNATSGTVQGTTNGAFTVKSQGSGGLTLQSGSGTVSLGTSTALNANGALTISSGGTTNTLALSTPASTTASTGAITILSGSATTGTNLSAGTVTIDTGTKTGTGTATINIGNSNATLLNVGGATASTVALGTGVSTISKASTALTVDLSNASNSVLTVTNSGAGTASLSVEAGGSFGGNLSVTSGGITVAGNSTINGTLGSLTGLTSSGSVTFSGLSTAGIVTNTAAGLLGTVATLPVANGGTGNTSVGSAGSVGYSDGSKYQFSGVGTSGNCLISGGSGAPTWNSCAAGIGTGTANTITMFTGTGTTIGNSILTQSGTTVSVGGTLNATTALQTAATTRVDNSGNLLNIGTITGQGTATATDSVVLNRTLEQGAGGSTTYFEIASLPTSTAGTYDHLHLTATLNNGWAANQNSYLDMTFGNRNGFGYQYSVKGAALPGAAKIVAYQNGTSGSSVDIYIVFVTGNYVSASYNVLENLGETVYPNPGGSATTTAPTGTVVFDTSASSTYKPSSFTDNSNGLTINGGPTLTGSATSLSVNSLIQSTTGIFDQGNLGSGTANLHTNYVSQGAYLGWNIAGGDGRTYFVNSRGGGAGGFEWWNTDASTQTQLATLDNAGNFNATGSLTATSATINGTIRIKYASANSSLTTPVAIFDNPSGGTQTVATFDINGTTEGLLRADNTGNIVMSGTGTGAVWLAYDGGTGGVKFGNGAGGVVATMDNAGNLNLNGSITATSGAINGTLTVKTNSATAFQVMNTSNTPVVAADTNANKLVVRGGNGAATYGANLVSSNFTTGWTATGWTTTSTTATHNSGNTSVLSSTWTPTIGATYIVYYAYTGCSNANTLAVSMGGVTLETATSCSGSNAKNITATSTAALSFTPSSGYTGVISNVVVSQITSPQTSALTIQNSGGSTALEVRASVDSASLFIGTGAGQYDNYGGDGDNTGVGQGALRSNSSGDYNAAFGNAALGSNTTGEDNTGLGYAALYANTIGTDNTAVGQEALAGNTTGYRNTVLGSYAGFNNATGSNDTYIGFQAGYADANSFLTGTALQNATAIGYAAQVQASNSLVLGGIATATNVGIGTTIPLNTFSVSPVNYSTGTAGTSGSTTTTVTGSGTSWTTAMIGMQFIFQDGQTGTITAVGSTTSLTLSASVTETGTTQHYRIHNIGLQVTSAGNVGIGVSSPAAALEIASSSTGPSIRIDGTTNARLMLVSSTNSNSWSMDDLGGQFRVYRADYATSGLGANGAVALQIDNGLQATFNSDLTVGGNFYGNNSGQINSNLTVNGALYSHGRITVYDSNDGYLRFGYGAGVTISMAGNNVQDINILSLAAINTTNRVCIANSSCSHALGVTGQIAASGSITASTTPDLAETIPAAPDVTAADVVMADPDNTERVVKATGAYTSAVVGVISDGTSSFMINAHANSENAPLTGAPMVLAGRVPVKVTNEGGSIKPGDYLTTSSTPGMAMKATHAGATIGKALGFFNGDTGTVMALINISYYDPTDGSNLQGSTMDVSGDATIGGDLSVAGLVTASGLTLTNDLTVQGLATVQDIVINGHIITAGTAPTTTVNSVFANGAVTTTVSGNDTTGTITIMAASNMPSLYNDPNYPSTADLSNGVDILQTLFAKQFGANPRVLLSPANANAGKLGAFTDSESPTGFAVAVNQLPEPGKVYKFTYWTAQ